LAGRKEAHDIIMVTMSPFRGRKVKVTKLLNAVTEISHIFGTGRPTNFKLGIQIEHDDPYPC